VAANTLASVTYSTMQIAGAAIGGAVAAIFGAQIALVVDSVSYGLSAMLLWRIASPGPPTHEIAAGGGWSDLVEGLRFTLRQPEVGPAVLVKGLGQLGSIDVIAAALAARVFSLGRDGGGSLGLLWAAFGVGTILGPPVGNLFHRNTTETIRRVIVGGYAAIALGWLLIGVSPWFPLTLAAFALRGLGGSLNWVYSDILIQMRAPGRFLGRVFSINLAFFTLVVSVSAVISGALLDRPGVDPGRLSLWFGLLSLLPLAVWWSAVRRPAKLGVGQER